MLTKVLNDVLLKEFDAFSQRNSDRILKRFGFVPLQTSNPELAEPNSFGTYLKNLAQRMFGQQNFLSRFLMEPETKAKTCLILSGTDDWNGALKNGDSHLIQFYHSLGYQVQYFILQNKFEALLSLAQSFKPSRIVISCHGNTDRLFFSKEFSITINSAYTWGPIFNRALADGGKINLSSCNPGFGGYGQANMANALAQSLTNKKTVVASKALTNSSDTIMFELQSMQNIESSEFIEANAFNAGINFFYNFKKFI